MPGGRRCAGKVKEVSRQSNERESVCASLSVTTKSASSPSMCLCLYECTLVCRPLCVPLLSITGHRWDVWEFAGGRALHRALDTHGLSVRVAPAVLWYIIQYLESAYACDVASLTRIRWHLCRKRDCHMTDGARSRDVGLVYMSAPRSRSRRMR